jgi:hypothetical protein
MPYAISTDKNESASSVDSLFYEHAKVLILSFPAFGGIYDILHNFIWWEPFLGY